MDGPTTIPDPEAKRPDDWDDDMDGDWEPPHVSNPDYKGEWVQKSIPNPAYKGPWSPPLIPNPEHKEEPLLHAYKSAYIGLDLWQVKSGSIFDNIIITDDVESASAFAEETFVKFREDEKSAKSKLDEEEKAESGTKSTGEDDDDIIDMDVTVGDEGKITVSEPDPNLDLKDDKSKPADVPPVVDQNEEDIVINVRDEKVDEKGSPETESKESTDSSPVPEESTTSEKTSSSTKAKTKTASSATPKKQEEKDEFDKLFEDFEEELSSPKRDEL